ncbi:MAG: hypothetical protein ACRC20_10290 [Segniliparus sp.]|uniref:hypothetical protein n=1 Tax=Segniliparus sp. TaxID=2804064 RepID=UPI003F3EA77C
MKTTTLRRAATFGALLCITALGPNLPAAHAEDQGVTLVVSSKAVISKRDKIDMATYQEVYNVHDKFDYELPRACTVKYSTPPKHAEPLPGPDANWISVQCPPNYGFKTFDVDYKWSYDPQNGKGVISKAVTANFPADGMPHKKPVQFQPMHPGPSGSLGLHAKLIVTPIINR